MCANAPVKRSSIAPTRAVPSNALPERPIPTLLGLIFLLGIVTQRLGIWVGGFPIALSIVLVLGAPIVLWFLGIAKLQASRALAFSGLICVTAICTLSNIAHISLPSYALFTALYFPFCFTVPIDDGQFATTQRRYAVIAMIFGIVGVVQYAAQFLVPFRAQLFSWAWIVPANFLIEYNSLNNLHYLSPIFKSNGFFFLEASAVSQLLARTLLIGRYYGLRGAFVILTLIGIAVTYSGGGMVLIAIFLIPLIIREVRRKGRTDLIAVLPYLALPLAGMILALGMAQTGIFHIEAITDRVAEVNTPGSSGWARYGSSLLVIDRALDGKGSQGLIFGIGPGQAPVSGFQFEVFTVAWVKIVIEYGLLGLTAFSSFLGFCIWSSTRSLFHTAVLMFCFLFIDSNLLVPQYVFFLMMLGSLPQRRSVLCNSGAARSYLYGDKLGLYP